jgi:DNA-binding transcriptional regulator YdaS (Cro superfamily)
MSEPDFEPLRAFLKGKPLEDQEDFAARCKTTIGYLRKAMSAKDRLGADLVLRLERESDGAVRCEKLRPDVDWAYLRGSSVVIEPSLHGSNAA